MTTALDGVLVSRGRVRALRRRDQLLAAARQHASRILRQARRDLDAQAAQAFERGYQDGYAANLADVASLLQRADAQADALWQALRDRLRGALAGILRDPLLLGGVLDEWLDAAPAAAGHRVTLTLPCAARAQAPALRARLHEAGFDAIAVVLHEQPRFLIEVGDQLAEFSPARFAAAIEASLLPADHYDDLRQRTRHAAASALASWRHRLALAATSRFLAEGDPDDPASGTMG